MAKDRASGTLGRREVMLGASGALVAATMSSEIAGASPTTSRDISLDGLPSEAEIWRWHVEVAEMGARHTGSPAHLRYIDWLEDHFAKMGFHTERLQHSAELRWAGKDAGLQADGRAFEVLSLFPFSGITPPAGVTAALFDGGMLTHDYRFSPEAEGKIVLLSAEPRAIRLDEQFPDIIGQSPLVTSAPGEFARPAWVYFQMVKTLMKHAEEARAAGVILSWKNVADDAVRGVYVPASQPYSIVPGIWVGERTGDQLRKLATTGKTANLRLDADVARKAPSSTLIATLPGISPENIILWSHTDGPNVVEENGGLAVIGIARHFARLKREQRPRTLTCVLVDGHFNEHYLPSFAWQSERKDLLTNAFAAVCVEHLGAREWSSGFAGAPYKPTGAFELGISFATTAELGAEFAECIRDESVGPVVIYAANNKSWGPGLAIARDTGVPTLQYVPIPTYITQESSTGGLEYLDSGRFHGEMTAFARLIHRLQHVRFRQKRAIYESRWKGG